VQFDVAIAGFFIGVAIGAGTIVLAAQLTQGRMTLDVLQRPAIRLWAAIYLAVCGIVGAIFVSSP
jgi:hypothetical protein